MSNKINIFHNILNNPLIFLFLRFILDGGQLKYLKNLLSEYRAGSVLDVACGCGIFSKIVDGDYLGIDYNSSYIAFCNRKFGRKNRHFEVMDATNITIPKKFDTAIIINSIHHFSDNEVEKILVSMKSVTNRLVIIHDAVPRRNPISNIFYKLDRGKYFRTIDQQKKLIKKAGLKVLKISLFKKFPGIYLHSTFICSLKN